MKKCLTLLFLFIECTSCAPGFYERISEREMIDNKIIGKFAMEMKQKGFSPCAFGGGELGGKTRLLTVGFQKDQLIDIKTGRKMITGAIIDFLEIINSDEQYRKYLSVFPFTAKNIKLSIYSTKEPFNGDRDHVSYISAPEGFIYYEGKNPDPHELRSVTLLEETFEEAVEILKKEGAFS